MTAPDSPQHDDESTPPAREPAGSQDAPGVELGAGEGGGTFEPEEDAAPAD